MYVCMCVYCVLPWSLGGRCPPFPSTNTLHTHPSPQPITLNSLEEDVLPFVVRQQFKGPDAFGPAVSHPVGNSEAEVSDA